MSASLIRVQEGGSLPTSKYIKKMSAWFKKTPESTDHILPRSAHELSRQHISASALKVLYRLHNNGFSAYLVGGGVRDLLLGKQSKDFDVVTNATPDEVRDLFSNSRIIGRRFKIVHVVFHEETIEVSTFRAQKQNHRGRSARIRYENTFGSLEEDVWRRDFTVNALYYNIADFSILDHVGGMNDLKRGMLCMIGDPAQRFQEDPVRLLRAIRFKAKLDFRMHNAVDRSVRRLAHLLQSVPSSRLLHEFEKLFFTGYACAVFYELQSYDYLSLLMPSVNTLISQTNSESIKKLIQLGLENTDQRYQQGKSLNPAFLFAVVLWPVLMEKLLIQQEVHKRFFNALHAAIQQTIAEQQVIISIPKRYFAMIRSIWVLQFALERRRPKRVRSLLRHRYFRAAMDLLELRAASGEDLQEISRWWRHLESADEAVVDNAISQHARGYSKKA